MRAYVGVTDLGWARHLASRPEIHEVNFWRPRDTKNFGAIVPGEPFLFKTRQENRVVGGAIFQAHVVMPLASAWDFFGQGNGVASLEEFINRIGRLAGEPITDAATRPVSCILLRDAIFFEPASSLPAPDGWSGEIMQGKTFEVGVGNVVIDAAVHRVLAAEETGSSTAVDDPDLGPTRGEKRLVATRLGQNGFKAVVQEAYGRRCSITGHKILPTLQAAHIVPIQHGGPHRVNNGLLLRSDVHTLFDRGYVGVDTDYCLRVSPRIRRDFGNGDELYERDGLPISVPSLVANRPSREALEWHLETVFERAC